MGPWPLYPLLDLPLHGTTYKPYKVQVVDGWNGRWFMKVEDQMKLLENCWSELLLLDVLYKQLEHSDTQQLLMVLSLSLHVS